MIKWDKLNREDTLTISEICKRAVALRPVDLMTLNMDVSAAHINEPLNLERLKGFDDFNLLHDVYGIMQHVDRNTGELQNCFVPRCGTV